MARKGRRPRETRGARGAHEAHGPGARPDDPVGPAGAPARDAPARAPRWWIVQICHKDPDQAGALEKNR